MKTFNVKLATLLSLLATAGAVRAEEATARVARASAVPGEAPTMPERTSLPWQLRPMTGDGVVRVETGAAAFNDGQGNLDIAVPTVFSATTRLSAHWAPTLRLAFVGNNAPGAALDGAAVGNPLVGATYTRALGPAQLALFGATTIPVGTGGGDTPNLRAAETNAAAIAARPADAAMFAVNYLTAIVGADLAYVSHGFTAQAEVTLLQLVRVRGGDSGGATDALRTQAAVGLHLGYFFGSHLSLSSDLHVQRWLSPPTPAGARPIARVTFSAGGDTATVAIGPRAHFRVGHAWIRPGVSLVRGLDTRGFDAPLLTGQTTAVQLDIPVTF